jgi:quercetin dioxygenase-like cupin family protein
LDSWDIRSLDVQPHHPKVLRTDKEARAIAIKLPAGEGMQQHQTYERAYLVVVEGEVEVAEDDGDGQAGGPGFVAHFEPNERRTVRAESDALLVLILGPWPGEGHYPYR